MDHDPTAIVGALSGPQLALAGAAFLLGGLSKGFIGFGMPLIAVSLMSLAIPVEAVLSFNAVAIVVLNLFQTGGPAGIKYSVSRFTAAMFGIPLGCVLAGTVIIGVDRGMLVGFIGIMTAAFCVHSWVMRPITITERHRSTAGFLAGALGGFLGTLTGVHGPPMIIYLASLRLEPQTFKRAIGLLFLVAGIASTFVISSVGFVTPGRVVLGLLWTLPGALGMWLGNRLSRHVNPAAFRTFVLIGLMVLAVSLIRRAFF